MPCIMGIYGPNVSLVTITLQYLMLTFFFSRTFHFLSRARKSSTKVLDELFCKFFGTRAVHLALQTHKSFNTDNSIISRAFICWVKFIKRINDDNMIYSILINKFDLETSSFWEGSMTAYK